MACPPFRPQSVSTPNMRKDSRNAAQVNASIEYTWQFRSEHTFHRNCKKIQQGRFLKTAVISPH